MATEYKSTIAATLQRHTRQTHKANLCKEAASCKHQQEKHYWADDPRDRNTAANRGFGKSGA